MKSGDKFKTVAAISCTVAVMLVTTTVAYAGPYGYQLRATFFEAHNWDGGGAGGGSTNTKTDALTDIWSLEIVSTTDPFALDITKVKVTLPSTPSNVVYDTTAAGSHPVLHFAHSTEAGTSGVSAPSTVTVADGGTVLTMGFTSADFGVVGDVYEYGIDVDNSNAVIRGYSTNPAHAGIGGNSLPGSINDLTRSALLDIEYTAGGTPKTASAHFLGWANGPGGLAHSAFAEVTLVPAPAAVVLGMLGLGLVGWIKRRFA